MKTIWLICCNVNQGHEEEKFSSHLHYCKARVTQLKSIALNFLKQDKTYKELQGCFKVAQFKEKKKKRLIRFCLHDLQKSKLLPCFAATRLFLGATQYSSTQYFKCQSLISPHASPSSPHSLLPSPRKKNPNKLTWILIGKTLNKHRSFRSHIQIQNERSRVM